MTDELKKLIFSPKISKVFTDNNWVINRDSKSKFHSFFIGDIADYYLKVHHENFKIYLQFTLDIDIPNNKINDLLILINIANQNSKDGFFVFDFKFCKIKYNLISPYFQKIDDTYLQDFLKNNLNLTESLFQNLVSGIHNLIYGEKFESAPLELLFMNSKGCA